ncbi:hypothetical protein L218DRAFT_437035 [Marasmius fiardii PR-910]|nr:hypothetical protein L218DRAFT_437035 [Marasmius fiardii PR-910]
MDLGHNGRDFIQKVVVNPNTTVTVHSVGPAHLDRATNDNVIVIIYAGAPGEQTGPSIVDVLWGAVEGYLCCLVFEREGSGEMRNGDKQTCLDALALSHWSRSGPMLKPKQRGNGEPEVQ